MDGHDLAEFAAAYSPKEPKADLNGDTLIDSNDLALFAKSLGRTDCRDVPGPEIGTWIETTPLPQPISATCWAGKQLIIYDGRVYVFGGQNAEDVQVNVYHSMINSDGSLGSWVETTPLPGRYFD